jgi:hypothetical protein
MAQLGTSCRDLLRHAQESATRPWIRFDFNARRSDRLASEELDVRRHPTDANGEVRWAYAPRCTLNHRSLDDAILKGVIGHHNDPPTRVEQIEHACHGVAESCEFVVDRDA